MLLRAAASVAAVAAVDGALRLARPRPRAREARSTSPGMQVELGDLQQQVAPRDPAAPVEGLLARRDAVDPVEPAGQHQPLEGRPGDPGSVEEVGQRGVAAARACRDDAGHLGGADALDVGEGEPDRMAPGSVVASSARSTT